MKCKATWSGKHTWDFRRLRCRNCGTPLEDYLKYCENELERRERAEYGTFTYTPTHAQIEFLADTWRTAPKISWDLETVTEQKEADTEPPINTYGDDGSEENLE